jgi:peptidase M48-like protein/tetratricopeptide repeat protein
VRGRSGGALLPLVLATLVACATPAVRETVADRQPGERPAAGSDEAGLWMQADRLEARVKTASLLVTDTALRDYVHGVVCRIVPRHCPSIRVYVVRHAEHYASMAPNGMIVLTTGLLLRTANEAQLAFVLGHEAGHYVRRHNVQQWRNIKASTGFGSSRPGSDLPAFSREQEHEADRLGFDLMVAAGYEPRESARAWERLVAERKAREKTPTSAAMHPPTAERVATLRQYAEAAVALAEPRVGREEYQAKIRPIRAWLLADEIGRRDFASSEVLLEQLIEDGDGLSALHYAVGEIHRLRGTPADLPKAVAAYRRAVQLPDAPAEAFRSLGIVETRLGHRAAARDALARYLEREPNAPDRGLVERQILDLGADR